MPTSENDIEQEQTFDEVDIAHAMILKALINGEIKIEERDGKRVCVVRWDEPPED
jgi:hypothetical protein